MKGLFLDSIYKTIDSIKLLILILFVIGVGIISFVDSQFILQAFISSIFLSISVSALISVRKDISSKWYKYEMSLPVDKKVIVESKFLAFLFWLVISIALAAGFVGIVVFFKGYRYFDLGMRDILTLFFMDVSFSLSFCSLFYVGLYLLGLEKCDVLVIICIILAVACMLAIIYLLNVMHVSIENGRMFILASAVILFIIGMNISQKLYCSKEL
jgi:hypothetical protein